jgi:signal transduction histidine kinase
VRSKPHDTLPPERDSVERVTVSSLPVSAPIESGAVPRRTHVEHVDLPSAWLDRLLVLWSELPIAQGERAVARAVVHALHGMVPELVVGICLVPAEGGAQEIVRAGDGADGVAHVGGDPARLFPGLGYELACEVDPGGTTLHFASNDAVCEDPRAPSSALALRAAAIARRGLELARVQARAGGAVAELESLHAHMVQAEKLASLGQIAAGVVHELNNPLTSIVAYTDWLLRKAEVRAAHADEVDRLNRIKESAGRMLRFTRDLVSYARPSSEVPVAVSVHLVLEQAVAFCEHVLADACVRVVRELSPHLPPVRGKPEQLAQIFVNLITNASHAMQATGGTLTIRTFDDGGRVRVEIADTGHGIAPEHLAHVFTPFFTTKTSGAGTGLGLAIVKGIVDAHGGTISAVNGPDQGATFTVSLPAPAGPPSR